MCWQVSMDLLACVRFFLLEEGSRHLCRGLGVINGEHAQALGLSSGFLVV